MRCWCLLERVLCPRRRGKPKPGNAGKVLPQQEASCWSQRLAYLFLNCTKLRRTCTSNWTVSPSFLCLWVLEQRVMLKYTVCCRFLPAGSQVVFAVSSPGSSCFPALVGFVYEKSTKKFVSVKTFHTRGTFIWAAARPSTGRSRSIWWHLSWRLWELQRPLSLPAVDSAVRKIRRRRFSRARRNSQRCFCFQQNSRKTTENKCRGGRAKIALDLCNCACRQACKREAAQNLHSVQIQWEWDSLQTQRKLLFLRIKFSLIWRFYHQSRDHIRDRSLFKLVSVVLLTNSHLCLLSSIYFIQHSDLFWKKHRALGLPFLEEV